MRVILSYNITVTSVSVTPTADGSSRPASLCLPVSVTRVRRRVGYGFQLRPRLFNKD